MYTTKEIAKILNGMEYGNLSKDIVNAAKCSNIVICYGASDDLVEFAGAFDDEEYGPGKVYLSDVGLLEVKCGCEDCPHEKIRRENSPFIKAIWNDGESEGPAWTYETSIPHETFNIMEDGEVWCRGIVFKCSDVRK